MNTFTPTIYSTIPLVWHPWDWAGAELLNALADQTVPVLIYVPIANILLLLLHLGCTTKQRSIPSANVHWSASFI